MVEETLLGLSALGEVASALLTPGEDAASQRSPASQGVKLEAGGRAFRRTTRNPVQGTDYVVEEWSISIVHSVPRAAAPAPTHVRSAAELVVGGPMMTPAEASALLANRSEQIETQTSLKVPPDRAWLFYHSRSRDQHTLKRRRGAPDPEDECTVVLTGGGPKTGTIYWSQADASWGVLRTACTQKAAPKLEAVKFLLVRRPGYQRDQSCRDGPDSTALEVVSDSANGGGQAAAGSGAAGSSDGGNIGLIAGGAMSGGALSGGVVGDGAGVACVAPSHVFANGHGASHEWLSDAGLLGLLGTLQREASRRGLGGIHAADSDSVHFVGTFPRPTDPASGVCIHPCQQVGASSAPSPAVQNQPLACNACGSLSDDSTPHPSVQAHAAPSEVWMEVPGGTLDNTRDAGGHGHVRCLDGATR